jgi:hypothetical protein
MSLLLGYRIQYSSNSTTDGARHQAVVNPNSSNSWISQKIRALPGSLGNRPPAAEIAIPGAEQLDRQREMTQPVASEGHTSS